MGLLGIDGLMSLYAVTVGVVDFGLKDAACLEVNVEGSLCLKLDVKGSLCLHARSGRPSTPYTPF